MAANALLSDAARGEGIPSALSTSQEERPEEAATGKGKKKEKARSKTFSDSSSEVFFDENFIDFELLEADQEMKIF
jgi:hypothetical protein